MHCLRQIGRIRMQGMLRTVWSWSRKHSFLHALSRKGEMREVTLFFFIRSQECEKVIVRNFVNSGSPSRTADKPRTEEARHPN